MHKGQVDEEEKKANSSTIFSCAPLALLSVGIGVAVFCLRSLATNLTGFFLRLSSTSCSRSPDVPECEMHEELAWLFFMANQLGGMLWTLLWWDPGQGIGISGGSGAVTAQLWVRDVVNKGGRLDRVALLLGIWLGIKG